MAIIRLYISRRQDNPEAAKLLDQLRSAGFSLDNVVMEHVLRVQLARNIPMGTEFDSLQRLVNPVTSLPTRESVLVAGYGPIREVTYRRAWTDPEVDAAFHAADTLRIEDVEWVRLSRRYQFVGLTPELADQVVERYLINQQVQTVLTDEWNTLVPQGDQQGIEIIDVREMDIDALVALSDKRRLHMTKQQLLHMQAHAKDRLDRALRDGEIESFAAAWSDHCWHSTYKALGLLERIQAATSEINHPLVISAFVDNSGVMKFYGGRALCIKGETHISPTFGADVLGGILTMHGGLLRDLIGTGQGGYPVMATLIMGTCDPRLPWDQVPAGAFHPRRVIVDSIRGTAEYNNPMGVPMGRATFLVDKRNWKGLALGQGVGILPADKAKMGTAQKGNLVVLIGGLTGRDGLHGATVSSGSMTAETSIVDAAHVQIGAPIEERKFMEAIPILRDRGCIVALTDCGAAGLQSACGEMGKNAGGIWVNLHWVPLKSAGLAPWEILLSESQERMVLAIPPIMWAEAKALLEECDVRASVIGEFTDTGSFQVVYDRNFDYQAPWSYYAEHGAIVVNLPYSVLSDGPLPEIRVEPRPAPASFTLPMPGNPDAWVELCKRTLGHFNLSDQSKAAHRFDQTVQGRTYFPYMGGKDERMPDDLYVSTPVYGQPWAMGAANAVNQYYGDVDPYRFGELMYVQAITKLVAAGFDPREIGGTCVNVYTPKVTDSPQNAWALQQLVSGYTDASKILKVPVISGKDSSSGTFYTADKQRIDAPLTLDVLALGRHRNAGNLIPKPFANPGDKIILYTPGLKRVHLGGSVLYDLHGQRGNQLTQIDLKEYLLGMSAYHMLLNSQNHSVCSRAVVAEGGLLRSLFECCVGSGYGCSIALPIQEVTANSMEWLFGELHGGILFTVDGRYDSWKYYLNDYYLNDGDVYELGVVLPGTRFEVEIPLSKGTQAMLVSTSVEELKSHWETTFSEVM